VGVGRDILLKAVTYVLVSLMYVQIRPDYQIVDYSTAYSG